MDLFNIIQIQLPVFGSDDNIFHYWKTIREHALLDFLCEAHISSRRQEAIGFTAAVSLRAYKDMVASPMPKMTQLSSSHYHARSKLERILSEGGDMA